MVTLSTWLFLKAFVNDGCWKLNSVQVNGLTVNDQSNLGTCSSGSNRAEQVVLHFGPSGIIVGRRQFAAFFSPSPPQQAVREAEGEKNAPGIVW